MSEKEARQESGQVALIEQMVADRAASLRRTKDQYDMADKFLIGGSIVFGAGTTLTAAAGLQLWAVALSALVTGTITAQHWFALGPRAHNADLAQGELGNLELDIQMGRVDADKAAIRFQTIQTDFIKKKPGIGSGLN